MNQSCKDLWPDTMNFFSLLPKLLVLLLLTGCAGSYTYKAYLGAPREALQVATLRGVQYVRRDSINRYMDAVKFSSIDGKPIENSLGYNSAEVAPGFHDVSVYYYWDMGSQKGLASALVSYASARESLNRTLRFNAQAGKVYSVNAKPIFTGDEEDITSLSHVDFWIEDQNGIEIVSKDAGRYQPQS